MLQITVCCDLTRVWHVDIVGYGVKERVCQHFKVCQREFGDLLKLPCEGRLKIVLKTLEAVIDKLILRVDYDYYSDILSMP